MPTPSPRRAAIGAVLAGTAVLAAGSAFSATWPAEDLLVPVGGAVLFASLVGAIPRRRIGGALRLVVHLVGFLVFAGVGVLWSTTAPVLPTADTVTSLADGLLDGWAEVLTFAVPVSGDPALLLVPAVLCWLAAALAAEAVWRSRASLVAAAPAVGVLVAARLLSPSSAGPAWVATAGVVLCGLGLLVWRTALDADGEQTTSSDTDADAPSARAGRARRMLLTAGPAIVVVAVLAIVLAPLVPRGADEPVSLRDNATPPLQDDQRANPLAEHAATISAGDRPVLRIEGAGVAGERWVLVALDGYDGTGWRSDARFGRVGTTLPAGPPIVGASSTVRHTVTVLGPLGPRGPWLPVPTQATSVHLDGDQRALVADPARGLLALGDGDVVEGLTYDVEAQIPQPTPEQLVAARLPTDPSLRPLTALPPGVPAELDGATTQAMGGAGSPFAQLAALESWFRTEGFEVDPEAPTGSSYGILRRFVAQGDGTRRGNDEQFASAFAVMARLRGFPSRVVVGWTVDTTGGDVVLNAADTSVWPEVYLDGLGWVPFDPLPGAAATGGTSPQIEEVEVAKAEAVEQAQSSPVPPAPPANPLLAAPPAASSDDGGTARWLLAAGVLALGLLVWVASRLVVPVRRRRRRARRRRGPDDRSRVLGAWHDTTETLESVGTGSLRAAPVPEVVAYATSSWGPEVGGRVATLGARVNDALYAPHPTDAPAGDASWDDATSVRRAVRSAAGRRRWLRGVFRPPVSPG